MLKRYRSAAIGCVALILASGAAIGAGLWSTLPIVGGAAFCASTVSGTGNLSGATGQGQGTLGSICGQTVPAGPSIVSGTELIPADLGSAVAGGPTQTVVLTLGSLNALPISYVTVTSSPQTYTGSNISGGAFLHLASGLGAAMTSVTVDLPLTPIDGQQFVVSGDANVTTLTMTALNSPAGVAIKINPTTMTTNTVGPYGYRFIYNLANNVWSRLQ